MEDLKKNHKESFTSYKSTNRVEMKTKLREIKAKYEKQIQNLQNKVIENENKYENAVSNLTSQMHERQKKIELDHEEKITLTLKTNRADFEIELAELRKKHANKLNELKEQLNENAEKIIQQKSKEKEIMEKWSK